ncbi:hypothetical protein TRIATDRAFT_211690 [Trichoderma atroviride IMI 206040]|uniref:NACHT domain-containing protein n=1 Tax=Hypocrea atroviridis (strain ATCC 20476 / IMI 206040) TaxID=452589 RepID=G9NGA6_HYPAI|nr:uncharacterized protein TRIATDRAFT_211690 [Trichoderma atroviride IMI 206040]EHK50318.1 hypothetical protein TRIATDRAFT_211690 [Trichoderma atroviride IMI 206040]
MTNPHDYTVGWICAIHTEYVAAQAFLDENHEGPDYVSPNDNNDYTLGKIGNHNIVIAVLPNSEYGLSSAAGVARDMLHSFPNLRVGLLVGIGGGAPSRKHDIRLGDVVVGVSNNSGKSAVFQYDFGKAMQGQEFLETGFLYQPPPVLRTAVNGLMAQYDMEGNQLSEAVNDALNKKPRLRKKGYSRPGANTDRLYQSQFVHANNEMGCAEACGDESSNLIKRAERDEEDEVMVHYGPIASANTLMKDALVRDKLTSKKDVLCFEMEAAGLISHFPCLVIRGICDYSDSHKNDEWQGYAAMVAAAYAKDLLGRISPTRVQAEKKISEVLTDNLLNVQKTAQDIKADVHAMKTDSHVANIERWLSPADPSTNISNARKSRHLGTGTWFLDSHDFHQWKRGSRRHLWLHGMPGCGKTILSATIFDHLAQDGWLILTFFFDFTDTKKQKLSDMLHSLAFQLYASDLDSRKALDNLLASSDSAGRRPDTNELSECVRAIMRPHKKLVILLDALDECSERRELMQWMKELVQDITNVQVIATGRPEHDLQQELIPLLGKKNCLPLDKESVDKDIRSYIKARLEEGQEFKRWANFPHVLEQIRTLQDALQSLPKDLNTTYARILQNIPKERMKKTIRLLQFLLYSERPLALEEAVDIIAVRPNEGQFDVQDRLPCPEEITGYCSSLISLIQASGSTAATKLQLAHFSVKEYLLTYDSPDFIYPNPRIAITETCLAYLGSIPNVETATIKVQFPLAEYAAQIWMGHAKVAEKSEPTLEKITGFLLKGGQFQCSIHLFNPDGLVYRLRKMPTASPLYYACLTGLTTTAQRLLSIGGNPNAPGGHQGYPLTAASKCGHQEIVQLLLDSGADVDAKGGLYGVALNAASQGGHEEIVQLLLDNGADINARQSSFGSVLASASAAGRQNMVQLLLDNGANVNAKGGYDGFALGAASRYGHQEIVQLLLDNGADVNAEGGEYGFALQAAAVKGHGDIVELLLNRGADINARGGYYGFALQAAAAEGHQEIVKLLLKRGANDNAAGSHSGCTFKAT